jgi:surface antigen
MTHIIRKLSVAVLAFICLVLTAPAYADPPYWAPAYGYHHHHHHHHHYYHNDDDYDYYYPEYEEAPVVAAPLPLYSDHPYVQVRCSNRPIIGAVLGGVAGGLIGNQFGKGSGRDAATVGGALLGVVLGSNMAADMARQDRDCMAQAFEYAKPGTQVAWNDPDSGDAYSVLPTRDFKEEGQYCREYQAHIRVDGELKNSYGTACRQPDGQWKIVK